MGPKGTDRVALFSTVVTHDVERTAPLYTEQVFRGFVDRTLTISPEDFGASNTTDRYSRRYRDLVERAGYELYASITYTPNQALEIQKADGDISRSDSRNKTLREEMRTPSGWNLPGSLS
jgi:hypothetical protein